MFPGYPLCARCMLVLARWCVLGRPAQRACIHRACIHHMSTAPAPLPDNSIKELVGDAATTESLLACKIGGCCGKDTPLLPLPDVGAGAAGGGGARNAVFAGREMRWAVACGGTER